MILTEKHASEAVIARISADSRVAASSLKATADMAGRLFNRLSKRRGIQPNGLLLGRVQSGKTTAMLLLAAAARDQGEQAVVILLGTTNLLYKQNRERLDKAFGLNTGQADWAVLEPKTLSTAEPFARKTIPSGRTLLIPILKHYKWIERAAELVATLNVGSRLTVIDDESDMASLGDGSNIEDAPTTNAALRKLLGDTSEGIYVHVTATPYAPLLLNPSDRLAPAEFALLDPGEGYIGSQQFFIDGTAAMRRPVSIDEISQVSLGRTAPALATALGIFVAVSIKAKIENPDMRATSMLIHPSSSVFVHRKVFRAIEQLKNEWMKALANDQIPRDLETGCAIAGLPTPRSPRLRTQLSLIRCHIVNADGTDGINWDSSPAHILIGGNKLSRGFTVEGLTVTFVARKPSQQADTMLQRARFYGYRIGLGGLMHLFASRASMETWKQAALMEKQLWDRLYEIRNSNGSVADLRRVVNSGASVAATANTAGSTSRLKRSPWYPSRPPEASVWERLGADLRVALDGSDHDAAERILASWPILEPEGNQAVSTFAFGLPMVQRFMERFRESGGKWQLASRSQFTRQDSEGFFVGLLGNAEWKSFAKSNSCGLYLAQVEVQPGVSRILPILHIAGGSFTLN